MGWGYKMDKASEIVKHADINQLIYYIEYVEILLEVIRKREIKDESLEEEHKILTMRLRELRKEKKY